MSSWVRNLPLGNEVELHVGQIVFWDDRPGWEGVIADLPSEDTLSVVYTLSAESDVNISRDLFSVKP